MPLSGKNASINPLTNNTYFFLDECLPHKIGDFLHGLGYPIVSWFEEFNGQQGWKDTPLIQYLGGKHYTWITKDDAAKTEHENDIRTAGISVIWIRGLERVKTQSRRNKVSVKQVHRMLTDRLDYLESEISKSKSATYYLLTVKTGSQEDLVPVVHKISLQYFFNVHLPKMPDQP